MCGYVHVLFHDLERTHLVDLSPFILSHSVLDIDIALKAKEGPHHALIEIDRRMMQRRASILRMGSRP